MNALARLIDHQTAQMDKVWGKPAEYTIVNAPVEVDGVMKAQNRSIGQVYVRGPFRLNFRELTELNSRGVEHASGRFDMRVNHHKTVKTGDLICLQTTGEQYEILGYQPDELGVDWQLFVRQEGL